MIWLAHIPRSQQRSTEYILDVEWVTNCTLSSSNVKIVCIILFFNGSAGDYNNDTSEDTQTELYHIQLTTTIIHSVTHNSRRLRSDKALFWWYRTLSVGLLFADYIDQLSSQSAKALRIKWTVKAAVGGCHGSMMREEGREDHTRWFIQSINLYSIWQTIHPNFSTDP